MLLAGLACGWRPGCYQSQMPKARPSWLASNQYGFFSPNLEAEDSVFSGNGGGVGAVNAHLDGCRVEQNLEGVSLASRTVRNCIFGLNSRYGLYFDPDGGVLSPSGSLFYANAGVGLFVGEDTRTKVEARQACGRSQF